MIKQIFHQFTKPRKNNNLVISERLVDQKNTINVPEVKISQIFKAIYHMKNEALCNFNKCEILDSVFFLSSHFWKLFRRKYFFL